MHCCTGWWPNGEVLDRACCWQARPCARRPEVIARSSQGRKHPVSELPTACLQEMQQAGGDLTGAAEVETEEEG